MPKKMNDFDSITYTIESFYKKNEKKIKQLNYQLKRDIYSQLIPFKNQKISKIKAIDLLLNCADRAGEKLQFSCEKHSIDFWLSIIRRLPNMLSSHTDWKIISTLAIIKWSNWKEDTTLGQTQGNGQFGVIISYTNDDLFLCFQIFALSNIISNCLSKIRWISKGAELKISREDFPSVDIPMRVNDAVKKYEARRPKNTILHDDGVPINCQPSSNIPFILLLGELKETVPIKILKNNFTIFLMNYALILIDPMSLEKTLLSYEEAIIDKFNSGTASILQVLYSLSRHIADTLPELDITPNGFESQSDINDKEEYHKLKFLFDICQKGLIRMPEKELKERLSNYSYTSTLNSTTDTSKLVDDFFSSYLLDRNTRNSIDLMRLQPCPIIFTSPGGNCYFDLTLITDFLRRILINAKDWYSTQHGDRFTLFLKNMIQNTIQNIEIIEKKYVFKTSDGSRAEADLLIKKDNVLYVIECKAYSKSRDYFIGIPKAIYQRNSKINLAVKQAKRTVQIIEKCLHEKTLPFSNPSSVEWIVCSSTQEFILPFDKYGMLTLDIPRVCTPEEIVKFLNDE